jgi:hypothetical protein
MPIGGPPAGEGCAEGAYAAPLAGSRGPGAACPDGYRGTPTGAACPDGYRQASRESQIELLSSPV